MKRLRISVVISIIAAIAIGTALFRISQRVQSAESDLHQLTEAVTRERQTIRVLKAEWDYLNRPDRLENLARTHLGMVSPENGQIGSGYPQPPAAPEPEAVRAQPVSLAPAPPSVKPAPPAGLSPVREKGGRDFRTLIDELDSGKGSP